MSHVTGILICTSLCEDSDDDCTPQWIKDADAWISKHWHQSGGHLIKLDHAMSLGKHPQMYVYGGGFNYFPETAFIEFLLRYPWQNADEVIIIHNPEEGPLSVIRPPPSRTGMKVTL